MDVEWVLASSLSANTSVYACFIKRSKFYNSADFILVACAFCETTVDDEVRLGEMLHKYGITVHYFCLVSFCYYMNIVSKMRFCQRQISTGYSCDRCVDQYFLHPCYIPKVFPILGVLK